MKFIIRSRTEDRDCCSLETNIKDTFNGARATSEFGDALVGLVTQGKVLTNTLRTIKTMNAIHNSILKQGPLGQQLEPILKEIVTGYNVKRATIFRYEIYKGTKKLKFVNAYISKDASTQYPEEIKEPKDIHSKPVWWGLLEGTHPRANIHNTENDSLVNKIYVKNVWGIQSFLSIPLWDQHGPVGVLILDNKTPHGCAPINNNLENDGTLDMLIEKATEIVEKRRGLFEVVDNTINNNVIVEGHLKLCIRILTTIIANEKDENIIKTLKQLKKNIEKARQANKNNSDYLNQHKLDAQDNPEDRVIKIDLRKMILEMMFRTNYMGMKDITAILNEPDKDHNVFANPAASTKVIYFIMNKVLQIQDTKIVQFNLEQTNGTANLIMSFEEDLPSCMQNFISDVEGVCGTDQMEKFWAELTKSNAEISFGSKQLILNYPITEIQRQKTK